LRGDVVGEKVGSRDFSRVVFETAKPLRAPGENGKGEWL
jgi:hypothetical protein